MHSIIKTNSLNELSVLQTIMPSAYDTEMSCRSSWSCVGENMLPV